MKLRHRAVATRLRIVPIVSVVALILMVPSAAASTTTGHGYVVSGAWCVTNSAILDTSSFGATNSVLGKVHSYTSGCSTSYAVAANYLLVRPYLYIYNGGYLVCNQLPSGQVWGNPGGTSEASSGFRNLGALGMCGSHYYYTRSEGAALTIAGWAHQDTFTSPGIAE